MSPLQPTKQHNGRSYTVQGTIKFQVKWEGWDKKSDLTWEPEDTLYDFPNEICP